MCLQRNDPELTGQNILIEISKGSSVKLEHDGFKLFYDRILDIPMPCNYGTFLGGKIQEDGDLLDAVILTDGQLKTGTIVPIEKLELLAVVEYFDKDEKDVKVIMMPKQQEYDTNFLNHKLYELSNYINYLYYYKARNNYVTKIYYSPLLGQKNINFRVKQGQIVYEEKNLKSLLLDLLS